MQRVLAIITTLVIGSALAGCTTTDSHADYDRYGYYDDPYAHNNYPPGYYQNRPYPPRQPYPGGYPRDDYRNDNYRHDDYRQDDRYRQEARRPAAPPIDREAVQAGDQLVAALDRYLQSINRYNDPQVNSMKSIISQFRGAAEQWRSGARAGGARQTLQDSSQDLLNRFNAANQLYAQMVAINPRWKSDNFGRVATATERVVYSVR
jgi:hypothetical protein